MGMMGKKYENKLFLNLSDRNNDYIPRSYVDAVWGYIGFGLVARLQQTTCECDNSKTNVQNFMNLYVVRYQHVDDPYIKVTLCDYSCLTEKSRKVKIVQNTEKEVREPKNWFGVE